MRGPAHPSTASYQNHDLSGLTFRYGGMQEWDFSGQDLTGADLSLWYYGMDLSGATIRDTHFRMFSSGTVLISDQIYSTTSYQAGDMRGLRLEGRGVTLVGWDLSGVDLSNAQFHGHFEAGFLLLKEFNFAGANLTDAQFSSAGAVNSNFSGADTRGAFVDLRSAITENTIHPDGTIRGLDLTMGKSLLVRDYDNSSPIPIRIEDQFVTDTTSTLRMILDADVWGSPISFEDGIPVTLDGTLRLEFAPDTDLASQIGRTIKLFDWSNVNATGSFSIESPYKWDVTKLYLTGDIRLVAVPEPMVLALSLHAAVWLYCSIGRSRPGVERRATCFRPLTSEGLRALTGHASIRQT